MSSSITPPFNIYKWIEENRHLLKPPVGNQQVYKLNKDFIVMVVGGPNARKDFHFNEGEELFFQIQGDIVLRIQENGEFKDIDIKEGDMFLLPPKVPHLPKRGANTVGLVIERYRNKEELDGFLWFCEQCETKLYEEYIPVSDIVTQLPMVMNKFYASETLRCCKKCGKVMEPPLKLA
jgi:3-hydroxyanthranilate 3,4-dioxygenase